MFQHSWLNAFNKIGFMFKKFSISALLALLSGILMVYAVQNAIFWLTWLCLTPLFIAINNKTRKQMIILSIIFGASLHLGGCSWMVTGAASFTKDGIFFGVLVLLAYTFFATLIWMLFFFVISWGKFLDKHSFIVKGLILASLWVLVDAIKFIVFAGQPWMNFFVGLGIAKNIWAIQPAAYFGVHVITFVVVYVNYLFAAFFIELKWNKVILPLSLIVGYLGIGGLMLYMYESNPEPSRKPFKLAILAENIPPEVKWEANTGEALVADLLQMNKIAVSLKSDMTLWSESSIPWKYTPGDDLLEEIHKISAPIGMTNLVGINTGYSKKSMYNSIYCFLPDGSISGRYDKYIGLDFIEVPVAGLIIPFFVGGSYVEIGHHPRPLDTPFGKAGVMICNESFVSESALNIVNKGAEFLVNPSNDGWFSRFDIVYMHFYNARLRAVETRKDLAINSNNGISGMVQSSGRIKFYRQDTQSFVKQVTITPNKQVTLYSKLPYLFVYFCITLLLVFFYFRFKPSKITD